MNSHSVASSSRLRVSPWLRWFVAKIRCSAPHRGHHARDASNANWKQMHGS
jgi:hypothetical protein